jgi:SAM-dependent methyltransferase
MAYTRIDHLIARLRFRAAYPHIRDKSRVCDIGCGLEAAFLDYAADRVAYGLGVDDQVENGKRGRWQLVHADIRSSLPLEAGQFDHVVMLAVLEHLTQPQVVLREARRILAPGGSLILTWPSGMVDPILHVLHDLRLISNEMESDEHQKRLPLDSLQAMLRCVGFVRFLHQRFEFGLNNLMVAWR